MFTQIVFLAAQVKAALTCERGATAIEYGLIAAGIAVAIMAVVGTVGTDLNTLFTGVGNNLAAHGG